MVIECFSLMVSVARVSALLAVGFHFGFEADGLLSLNECERVAETLVLRDCDVADTLVLAEDVVGKDVPIPPDFKTRLLKNAEPID
jgi:hypothetical protein